MNLTLAICSPIHLLGTLQKRQIRSSCLILVSLVLLGFADASASDSTSSPTHQRVFSPNDYQGTDTERINQAIDAAAQVQGRVIVPRINQVDSGQRHQWLLDSAILLRSNTTLELENCHLKLSDHCRDNFLRSANCGIGITDIQPMHNIHIRGIGQVLLEGADRPRATGDSGKTIGKRTYGTDANNANESQQGDWRNIGILMAFVENFHIENLTIKDSHCWAISLERCAKGTLRDLTFESSESKMIDGSRQTILNQDGIDLRMGCHDILIENISGHTGDDLIALTAIARSESVAGSLGSTMVSSSVSRGEGLDDIRHIQLRNIRGYSRGGHHIVRLLNTPGLRMYDIHLDGLIDTSPENIRCKAAVKIGDHAYGDGVAPLGDTQRIMIHNVFSKARHTILIGGSLSDSIFSNVIRHGSDDDVSQGDVVTIQSGADFVKDITISNALTSARKGLSQ